MDNRLSVDQDCAKYLKNQLHNNGFFFWERVDEKFWVQLITAQSIWSKIKLEELEEFYPLKYAIPSFGKWLYIIKFQVSRGWHFLNCDNTELKRSSKIKFSVSERHRWAVVGLEQ